MGRPRKHPVSAAVQPKKVHALEGFADGISETDALWDAALKKLSKTARVFGFARVETPLLEDMNLYNNFYRDQKSMLASVVGVENSAKPTGLRPSLLPSVLRAYAEGKVYEKLPLSKWFYSGRTVRRGAKGEMLEDFEAGFEVFGSFTHLTEAQVISAVWELLLSVGMSDVVLEINNIGNSECQATYQDTLHSFLSGKKYELCDACNESLSGRVLDVFRCQNLDCQAIVSEAPAVLDFLDEASHKHFTNILEALDELNIPYQLNPLYAGPAGYSRTNFVVKYKAGDKNIVLGEGGYHEVLMENVYGKDLACFGFSGSFMRMLDVMRQASVEVAKDFRNDVFLVPLGELASKKSLRLFRDLIAEKISVYDHFGNAGVKNQLKAAETYKAPIALIIGQKEAVDEMVILRDVKSGMQEIISYDKIVEEVKKRLGR